MSHQVDAMTYREIMASKLCMVFHYFSYNIITVIIRVTGANVSENIPWFTFEHPFLLLRSAYFILTANKGPTCW
jgi:hypothetical protein